MCACLPACLHEEEYRKSFMCIPFSDVSCFSGRRSMAAGNTAGSERPFALNAYTDAMYRLPGCKFDTAKRANGDVILARIS